jgi:hypothetical protein
MRQMSRHRRVDPRVLAVAAVLGVGSCNACPPSPPVTPLVSGATRGATTIDIYGKWIRTNDPLGRTPLNWAYQFQYVPAGTTVYANGTTSGPVLQPLDAGVVTWTPGPGTLVAATGAPSATPDANGVATITLRFGPPGQGTGTLSVTIAYGGGSGTDNTQFEVDSSAP